ncbi:asparagine synthase-related protein [Paenibacillus alkalitolerans]|uniref:asparagine synthase-related protein n=1 Tax=Paenibacillus alkalitolerans TaxID=2799335 RepID=UPI0018F45356|nr:asparagine synthase-related protein [Paenibacillus alkalitolerans]
MSAIAGILNFNETFINSSDAEALMQALRKYPADQVGTWFSGGIFLGCHVQWITPESIDEILPYYDPRTKLAITADAIIDNRAELFDLLQVEHDRRKKTADSELILLAYNKWGEEAPKYLVGDFAFMIWDERKGKLFGARDFSGTRTLYFYREQHRFAFCTVIKPLFSLPYIDKGLNEQWIAEFLAIPVTTDAVDTSSTVFKQIEQVPPSHSITVINGKVTFRRYCSIAAEDKLKLSSNGDYEEAFRDVFRIAVTSRIRAHREVGAQLSGGLDSGSVVSFAAKALQRENKQLHTFSYVPVDDFEDWTPRRRIADERPYIRSTVQYVGNISDHYLDFKGKSPLSEVDDWLEIYEMPYKFFENSFWIKGIYETAHQQGIGMLLNGQRGNWTVSWGPSLDYLAILLRKMRWIKFYRDLRQHSGIAGAKMSRLLPVIGRKAFPFVQHLALKKQDGFPLMINPDFARETNVFDRLRQHQIDLTGTYLSNAYEIRKRQFEKLYFWNINGTFGTKLSLRYSMWERDPTNDLRVIKFCLSVPEDQFFQDGVGRSLIRRSMKNLLPDEVRLNVKSRGVQGADGIHRMKPSWGAFMDELQRLGSDAEISRYINMKVFKEAVSKLQSGPQSSYIFDADFKVAMRSLIFYRFMKKFA